MSDHFNEYTLEIAREGSQYCRTDGYYRYFGNFLLTDGVNWLVNKLDCLAFIDLVITRILFDRKHEKYIATIRTPIKGQAVFDLTDSNNNMIVKQKLFNTDLYICNDQFTEGDAHIQLYAFRTSKKQFILMLPSEF